MNQRIVENQLSNADLIALLQQLDPDVPIRIPCPHCCGQPGADFDAIVPEFVQLADHLGQSVILLGDPKQECVQDAINYARRQQHT